MIKIYPKTSIYIPSFWYDFNK